MTVTMQALYAASVHVGVCHLPYFALDHDVCRTILDVSQNSHSDYDIDEQKFMHVVNMSLNCFASRPTNRSDIKCLAGRTELILLPKKALTQLHLSNVHHTGKDALSAVHMHNKCDFNHCRLPPTSA